MWRLIRYDLPLHFILMATNWLPDRVIFLKLRGMLVKPFLKCCGDRLMFGRNVTIYNPSNVVFGNDVYVAYGCWLLGVGLITLGDEVMLGPYVVISPSNHTKKFESFRFGDSDCGNVSVGSGSWVGAHSTLLKGAEIGVGSLIAANSVVNKSTENHSLYGGIPARFIKKLI